MRVFLIAGEPSGDALGQALMVVVQDRIDPAIHEVEVRAGGLGSGVYFYRMEAGPFRAVRKMALIR